MRQLQRSTMRYIPRIYALVEFVIAYLVMTSYSRVIVEMDATLPALSTWQLRSLWGAVFMAGAFILLFGRGKYISFVLGTLPIGIYGVTAGSIILYYNAGYISAIYYLIAYFATLALWAYYTEDYSG